MLNTNPPSKSLRPETVAKQKAREEPTPVLASHAHRNSPAANLPQSDAQSPAKGLSRQQKRRRTRQAQKSAALEARPKSGGHEMAAPQAEVVASRALSSPPSVVQSPPQVPSNERTSGSEQTSSSASNSATPVAVTMPSPPPANYPARDHGPLAMKAGMTTQGGDQFMPIRKIEPGTGFFNVIGVVTSTKPPTQTRSLDWCRIFSIVDPSCMEDDVDIVTYNFTVNCFQKAHIEWLPQAEVGDIVIFRRLKTSTFRGGSLNGIGYHDKLRWVTYDTKTRRFRDPDSKDAPRSETLDQGFGYSYSPYYEPSVQGKEAEYCAQLADWWQATQQGVTTVQCVPRSSREHHLISEVTPDTSPQGYFDCTVEILHSYENTSGPNTVYVTDYTVNPHTNPPQANWCSPELSAYVFKIDMWDDAGLLARTMQPGEFWSLPNTRAMTDSYLHFHGKLVETHKTKKLDEVENGKNLHFRALLERKKKFEQGGGASGSSPRFDTKLIEDVDEEVTFFHCTVEVLHVDLASAEEPLVYVTDYTFNPSLINPAEPAPWALGLDRRVVKITLEGGQKGRARDLQLGAMYRIKNLRLIKRAGIKGAFGRLGGDERLIIAVNDLEKEEVKALLRRKEKWKVEMQRDGVCIEPAVNATAKSLPPTPEISKGLTLKQVFASTVCPNTFTFVARVFDFYPLDLNQATYLRCTNLRRPWKCCIDCDDMLETHCKWFYKLLFILEDDEKNNIMVSACNDECKLLSGLPPADLEVDKDAFDRFVARLQPMIGNLRQVHDAYAKNEDLPVVSPKMHFTIESWIAGDNKRRRGLPLQDDIEHHHNVTTPQLLRFFRLDSESMGFCPSDIVERVQMYARGMTASALDLNLFIASRKPPPLKVSCLFIIRPRASKLFMVVNPPFHLTFSELRSFYTTSSLKSREFGRFQLHPCHTNKRRDWTVQFRNELEYFWTRSQPDWALSALPDPYPNNKPKTGSATDIDEALQYAIMAGLCYIMEKAYNRLIMAGLPRDAPPIVDDFEELRARPKHPENVPAWAEAVIPLGKVTDVPDSEGNVPTDENADEDFLRFGVRVATPHWVFV
ncbi:hypothetical protein DEU56DRAFT_748325 [Suillus clintonianus]|uniref:uncharacterized protein n=1 Tax=Suillus clintonianus TaxID=1904413 RepID=UPI001B87B6E8|nr:uncharacterized protein DEU56DRAFT_748325 [Suillus clintonianus]KAG2116402.1 hypothetical protein DEU56DRAFT_748325 [Suillus clintonianus]